VIVVGYRWVYTLKYRPDGLVDRYKARLIAESYTHTYGVNYFETFPSVARLNSIRILFSIVVNVSWPLFQLDLKNAFLYGDLKEDVYLEQPIGYVAKERIKYVISGRQYMDSSRAHRHDLRSLLHHLWH